MTLIKQDCYLLVCDGCGHDFEYDFIPHFDTEHQALQHLETVDGKAVVEDLTHKVYCETCVGAGKHQRPVKP